MNKTAIPQEALDRFRTTASQYTRTAKSRASRLLALKDDIAALRKRGISYRAISELLIQSGIIASDTCVTNFCHRVLQERIIRKSPAKRDASRRPKHPASSQDKTEVLPKTITQTAPATANKPVTASDEIMVFASRGPRIAKVEMLPPGETK